MFSSERKSPPAAVFPPLAADPAAGIASTPEEAHLMPAAPFSPAPAGEDLAPSKRQREIGPTQCRWIIADEDAGAEALMCGAPVEPRRPFCAAHCARAFLKVEQDGEAESAQDEDGQDENTEREAAE